MLTNVREKIKKNFQNNFLFLINKNPVQIEYETFIPIKNIAKDFIIHSNKKKNSIILLKKMMKKKN